jgi:hypothetical protein
MNKALCAAVALLMGVGLAGAADSENQFLLGIYAWGAGIEGDVAIAGIDAEVDVGFSEIVDLLDGGIMLHFEGSTGRWSGITDIFFVDLGQDLVRPTGVMDYEQWIVDGAGGYEVAEDVELLVGLRYVSIDGELRITDPVELNPGIDRSWLDPYVGARWMPRFGERWGASFRADIGGFGVDSDLTWQLRAMAMYDFSERWSLGFGLRFLDYDFEEGVDLTRFAYDTMMAGAEIGIGFRF